MKNPRREHNRGLFTRGLFVLKIALIYALVLVALLTLIRLVELFTRAYEISPWLAWGAAFLVAAPFLYLVVEAMLLYIRIPSAVKPPEPDLYASDPAKYARKCIGFAKLTAANLQHNPNLDEADLALFSNALKALEKKAGAEGGIHPDDLQEVWAGETKPVYEKLDAMAGKRMNGSAIMTALGTAVSRSPVLDGLIQIYQMGSLTRSIIKVYWTRPGLVVSFLLARDILASAGLLIVASKVTASGWFKKGMSGLAKFDDRSNIPVIPLLTGFADEAVQATLTVGLVRRYGKLVMRRCQAIEWDTAEARKELAKAIEAEAAKHEDSPADTRREVFELLRLLSQASGEQNPYWVAVMLDFVNENAESDAECLELMRMVRSSAGPKRRLHKKIQFWNSDKHDFERFSPESMQAFMTLVSGRANDATLPEEKAFIETVGRLVGDTPEQA